MPTLEEFIRLAERGNLIPVYREVLADMETPVSAYLKLGAKPHSFLLESVAGGEHISRYSFIGGDPFLVFKTKGRDAEIRREGHVEHRRLADGEDPLHVLKALLGEHRFVPDPDLPPFCGGAVGYIGYDAVRFFERLPDTLPDDRQLPDCYFVFTDTLLIFDHVKHRIKALCLARVTDDPSASYRLANEKIEALIAKLRGPCPLPPAPLATGTGFEPAPRAIPSREEHATAIARAKEYIAAGDIIQVVLSRRIQADVTASPFQVYRALRSVNPSPYMFLLQFEDCQLIGASPEILVTERAGQVVTRPIAGTVRRGKTPAEDAALEAQLLDDPKERAEHVMLVDLHRNDIGRVCEYGSVKVDQLMVTEKYSHVIHIVSNVIGTLRPDKDGFDLIRAAFPAGTLSGAPKIRAMQIIEELETVKRGPYGGCIGYFSFSGDMDTAITLRTIVMQERGGVRTAYIQAGGGIVADSDPDAEFQETENKAGAMLRAVELAERECNLPSTRTPRMETINITIDEPYASKKTAHLWKKAGMDGRASYDKWKGALENGMSPYVGRIESAVGDRKCLRIEVIIANRDRSVTQLDLHDAIANITDEITNTVYPRSLGKPSPQTQDRVYWEVAGRKQRVGSGSEYVQVIISEIEPRSEEDRR